MHFSTLFAGTAALTAVAFAGPISLVQRAPSCPNGQYAAPSGGCKVLNSCIISSSTNPLGIATQICLNIGNIVGLYVDTGKILDLNTNLCVSRDACLNVKTNVVQKISCGGFDNVQVCVPKTCSNGLVLNTVSGECVANNACPTGQVKVTALATPIAGISVGACIIRDVCLRIGVLDGAGTSCSSTKTCPTGLELNVNSGECACPAGKKLAGDKNSCIPAFTPIPAADACPSGQVQVTALVTPVAGVAVGTCILRDLCLKIGVLGASGTSCSGTKKCDNGLILNINSGECGCPSGQKLGSDGKSCVAENAVPACPSGQVRVTALATPIAGVSVGACILRDLCLKVGVLDGSGTSCSGTKTCGSGLILNLNSGECSCPSGQKLGSDGKSCVAENAVPACPSGQVRVTALAAPIAGVSVGACILRDLCLKVGVLDGSGTSCSGTKTCGNGLILNINSGECGCPTGQKLGSDGKSCVAENAVPACPSGQVRVTALATPIAGVSIGACILRDVCLRIGVLDGSGTSCSSTKTCGSGLILSVNSGECACPANQKLSSDGKSCTTIFTPIAAAAACPSGQVRVSALAAPILNVSLGGCIARDLCLKVGVLDGSGSGCSATKTCPNTFVLSGNGDCECPSGWRRCTELNVCVKL